MTCTDATVALEMARPVATERARQLLRGDARAAEELVEDVITSLWERSRSTSDTYSTAYVVQSVRNAAISQWRRRQTHLGKQHLLRPGAPEDMAMAVSARVDVERLLATLDERQRQLVTLRYLDGLPQAAIARRLQIPQGTVASATARALRRLRAAAAETGPPPR